MFERLIRAAAAMMAGILVAGVPAAAVAATEDDPAPARPADIELRKSFRSGRRFSRQVSRSGNRGDRSAPEAAGVNVPLQFGAVAAALGEPLQSSGTLHLPEVGGGGVVIHGSTTPILQTVTGRHLIIDRDRTIDPRLADEIAGRWPGFDVVQPPAGANVRDLVGSILDAAGYDSVLRSTPLIFGRGTTIRFTPDFVVLRNERDLLDGETRAISVVDAADALPPELRELAGEHRVVISELTPDGVPAGLARAPWRDAAGRVTTIESARSSPVIEELADVLGFPVERRGETAILLNAASDLTAAIGALLRGFGVPAIGPVVEFYREPPPGSPRRFVISVPGWLADSGGRRLLITGSTVPLLVRLYLTREGIDIFEYRLR